jgi:hypothetical protein
MTTHTIWTFRRCLLAAAAAALCLTTTTALAGSGVGAVFNLGQQNTVSGTSTLTGSTAGPQLSVRNTNTAYDSILATAGGGAGSAIFGRHTSAGGNGPAVKAESLSIANGASAIYALLSPPIPGANSSAIRAESSSTTAGGYGLWASHAGKGTGVFSTSVTGIGVHGQHTSTDGIAPAVEGDTYSTADSVERDSGAAGVLGWVKSTSGGYGSAGVRGINNTDGGGAGVAGFSNSGGAGVWADSKNGPGVFAFSGTWYAVVANADMGGVYANSISRVGVWGIHSSGGGTAPGVQGSTNSTTAGASGVLGESTSNAPGAGSAGVRGMNNGTGSDGIGVYGSHAGSGIGVYGTSAGYAGYFDGNVQINGTLSKTAGSFRIDHPLDPAHTYLQHSFVESPDMKDVYDGIVVTDRRGFATVTMPRWFQALNRSFRYQLTIVGRSFAQAIIWREVAHNRFTIRTNAPNVKVSWQLTGIRHDPYANDHRIKVEVRKPGGEQGKYVYPQAYGKSKQEEVGYQKVPVRLREPVHKR